MKAAGESLTILVVWFPLPVKLDELGKITRTIDIHQVQVTGDGGVLFLRFLSP